MSVFDQRGQNVQHQSQPNLTKDQMSDAKHYLEKAKINIGKDPDKARAAIDDVAEILGIKLS